MAQARPVIMSGTFVDAGALGHAGCRRGSLGHSKGLLGGIYSAGIDPNGEMATSCSPRTEQLRGARLAGPEGPQWHFSLEYPRFRSICMSESKGTRGVMAPGAVLFRVPSFKARFGSTTETTPFFPDFEMMPL